jgi:hypothetical protein
MRPELKKRLNQSPGIWDDPAALGAKVLLLAWAWLLVLYFLNREGGLRLDPLTEQVPWLEYVIPGFLLGGAHGQGAYPTILSSLCYAPFHVQWENIPWGALLWAFAALCLYQLLGSILLGCFDTCMPRGARYCIGFVLGAGASGVVMELVALAGLLTRWAVLVAWGLMLLAAWLAREWRCRRPDVHTPGRDGHFARSSRVVHALAWYRKNRLAPTSVMMKAYFWLASGIAAAISFLILLHAVGHPETYWDSLILYMGYARKMFLEHGFPTKVVGQVGIGLGANYPHLYPLLNAQTAVVAGYWNGMFAQLLPPVAGVASMLLVYYMAEELTRDRMIAVSVALLFRAVPYGIAYFQYASDYAIAILFTCAFLYCAMKYVLGGLPAYLALMLLFAGFAMHINYLMGILWPVAAVAVVVAHVMSVPSERDMGAEEPDREAEEAEENKPAAYDQRAWEMLNPVERDPLGKFLCSRVLWLNVFVSALIASPWYIRNIIVTGNPVYAFFYNIFPSRNVNPEVMRSAQVEWLMNGDGLGRVGATLWEKLANSWLYFVTGPHHWKLGPVFMALAVPGFVVFLCRIWSRLVVGQRLVNLGELPGSPPRTRVFDDSLKFGTVCGALFVLLWFYAYVIADMYLYQIIIVLPLFGIFVCGVFEVCNTRFSRVLLYVLCIVVGIGPGIMMGLMGFKLKRSGHIGATPYSQVTLTALRYLFIAPEEFYRMEFGGDMEMLGRVNSLPAGTRVLTHENRHLLLNEDIRIIHLDDWEVQKAYHKPASERLAVLDALGVE